jgi:hypothetical protein
MSDWPDVEGALRDYLRADAGVSALVGQRVFFDIPKATRDSSWPMITVARVGGATDASEVPLDLALMSIDVWGSLDASGNGDKAGAAAVVNAVRSALEAMNGRTTLTTGVDGFGVQEAGVVWLPDPGNGRPHYTVTAEVTAIAS